MSDGKMVTSAPRRMAKLGGLVGRVGASMVGERLRDFARSDLDKKVQKTEALVRNAKRIVETLGEMRGGAMKVGQMLSLHEGLLPEEVASVLRALQKKAPAVPFEVIQYEIKGQIENYDDLFVYLEPEAFAAASIGQVHRAELRDGRKVAVKVQYPAIDHIIRADLDNLRTIFKALFAMFSEIDFEPVWEEVRDRLLEEIDYRREADNLRRMAELHADVPEVIVPRVIEEASASGVLTMEFVEGIPGEVACSDVYNQELKNRWGMALLELQLRGLFQHRFLHADPNLANFAFAEDGRVIVYDCGCIKQPPEALVGAYAANFLAVAEGRRQALPEILFGIGVTKDGEPLPMELIDPYIDLLGEILRQDPPYSFGEDPDFYRKLGNLGMANLSEVRDVTFPRDVVFVDRSLGGHFGNLSKLRATGPWRDLVL
ncbi:MAG: AarF/ABC1/UbiB kinase family protein, partial [Acidobacteriota bacterium]